jgi:predicted membrane-bound spermidine synthase
MTITRASGSVYGGLFLITLATIVYEIALTRIFSVTMWYHFAFVAISVAMFGMTIGALMVYLRPGWFPAEQLAHRLGAHALLFGVTIVLSLFTQLVIPFTLEMSLLGVYTVVLTYIVVAIPFIFSGVCVTLTLTRFPRQLPTLYAVDLLGAAVGCALVLLALDATDGPTTVMATALIAFVAAAIFLGRTDSMALRAGSLVAVIVLGLFVAVNSLRIVEQASLLRVAWVKGTREARPLFEKWNSFSRVTVSGDPARLTLPKGWGLSATYPRDRGVHQLALLIDASAGTVLTGFDGRLETVEHLKYDVTNVPHWLRRNARVLVVGAGGGRDVLSALAFGQREVVGVEMNEAILDVVNGHFGAFTGRLDRDPRVTFVNDEARSYIARQQKPFDILQISLIDTWAATGAGALVLSEHSLYTTEAWRLFLDRLTPHGVLSVSRYYFESRPDEIYRATALAVTALAQRGVARPREHLAIVRHATGPDGQRSELGVATLLVSPSPLSEADVDVLEQTAQRLRFDIALSPRHAATLEFEILGSGRDLAALYARSPVNITPPTDDSPFFFHKLRLADIFDGALWRAGFGGDAANVDAVWVLGVLLVTVVGLTALCIVVPLVLTTERHVLRGSTPLFVFFAGIGLGFMLVEVSQMQRLIVFLGHPTYGLSVVLFAMLASSGIGSLVAGRLRSDGAWTVMPLGGLLLTLVVFGAMTPAVIRMFEAATTPARIAVAIGLLLPIGFLMGMAFPLGMRAAHDRASALSPWLWGINGATSVCASVMALAISLHWGIAASFWTGVACYVVATGALALVTATQRRAELPHGVVSVSPGVRL